MLFPKTAIFWSSSLQFETTERVKTDGQTDESPVFIHKQNWKISAKFTVCLDTDSSDF